MSNVFDEILRRSGVAPETAEGVTLLERLEAQLLYTALMTDTLIGEGDGDV